MQITLRRSRSAHPLPEDVQRFYAERQASFGAMNLLSRHLPSPPRVQQLVVNVMTVDYAISRALDVPAYAELARDFAGYWARSAPALEEGCEHYRDHFQRLTTLDNRALANELRRAIGDTMETINLFTPKQCNLSCRGCYAASFAVDKHPYDAALIDGYFDGATRIIAQARALGARTIYTSGDGEPTIYPKFFDLLEHIEAQGMTWLFFTAGLSFSSETNAARTWSAMVPHTGAHIRRRVEADIANAGGHPKPIAYALMRELARHRNAIEVYCSMWSAEPGTNSAWRRPVVDDFDYVTVDVRGEPLQLPSSIVDLMQLVFTGEARERMGIEMPVSRMAELDIGRVATFVVDHGLKSYFEPAIATGHNRNESLEPTDDVGLQPLMVRALCSFRNLHQPTIKLSHANNAFHVSPGMGVDLRDLKTTGVLDSLRVGDGPHGLFAAVHSPLIVNANYAFVTGCKCNDFARRLSTDRENLSREWQAIASSVDGAHLAPDKLLARLEG